MRFFISSTFEDLKEFRKYTIEYLTNLTDKKTGNFAAMEYFVASENTSKEVCLAELEKSDIVIGIYGSRFGWIEKETGRSMTEIEFDRAVELSKPLLAFVTYQEQEEKQKRFIHEKVFAQGNNCGRFSTLQDYADVLHESITKYFVDTEGYSYNSIWDDIKLMRQIIEEESDAGSLRMRMYEDGNEEKAIDQIQFSVNILLETVSIIHEMYAACAYMEMNLEEFYNFGKNLNQHWERIHLGLPNHLNTIRLAAAFLKLFHLQHRLLTEIWTEELRKKVIIARDEYLEIAQNSYHID